MEGVAVVVAMDLNGLQDALEDGFEIYCSILHLFDVEYTYHTEIERIFLEYPVQLQLTHRHSVINKACQQVLVCVPHLCVINYATGLLIQSG